MTNGQLATAEQDNEKNCAGESGSWESKTTSKRFRFTPDLDLLVLKVIQLSGAHVAEYSKATELYKHALVNFVMQESVNQKIRATLSHLTWKTIRDRFKAMMLDHKKISSKALGRSGVEENYSEKDQLLDERMDEMNDHGGGKRRAKEERV